MHAYFEQREYQFEALIAPHLNYPLHLHPQLELFLALTGESVVTVRGQTARLSPGSLAILFPNQIHSYTALSQDTTAALVMCDPSYTGGYAETLMLHHPLNPFLTPGVLHPNVPMAIHELLEEEKNHAPSPVQAPFTQIILARVMPCLSLERNRSSDHQELTYQIASYISEHFREPLTLGQLASEVGLSKYHLSHLFSEKIGQNFPSYLSGIRLSYACRMLAETDYSVTYIAEESGFKSQRTFFRAFAEHYQISPRQYRRNAQQ